MKAKVLGLWVLLALAPGFAIWEARAADAGFAGSWITDSVLIAKQMQVRLKEALKNGEEIDPFDDSPLGRAYRNQVNTNRGASSTTSSGIGRSSPTTSGRVGGSTGGFGGGGSTGGFGGGGGGGGFGGGGGGGGFGGGGRGGRGNNFLPAGAPQAQSGKTTPAQSKDADADAGDEEEEQGFTVPAITMELKVSKTKLTGDIVEISPDDLTEQKLKAEDGTVTGSKFKFITYKKTGAIQIPITWEGELTSEKSMTVRRKNASGKVLDESGEFVLTRVK